MKIAVDYSQEKLLIEHLRNGDHTAFSIVYEKYANALLKRINRLTKTGEVAEDLLQETFVKLWEKREMLDPELPVKPWLYKVAENLVYQFYRDLARDERSQEKVLAWYGRADLVNFEEAIFYKEKQAILQRAIAQLPPQRRQVFTLCRLQGHTYEEAAAKMGISAATVSNHLVKANASVRLYLLRHKDSILILLSIYIQSGKN